MISLLESELNEQLKARLINCEKKQMLRHIQEAINLAENHSYSVVDKEYFAELDEPLTVMDMLICASLCLEAELKEEQQ